MGLVTERTDLDAILIKQINLDANLINVLTYLYDLVARNVSFSKNITITRPANTTAYSGNTVMNQDTATTLPYFDFGNTVAFRTIEINQYRVMRSYLGGVFDMNFLFYNADNLIGQTSADGDAWNPTFTEQNSKFLCELTVATQDNYKFVSTGSSLFVNNEMAPRYATLDSLGRLYVAMLTNGGFTPTSASSLSLTIDGFIV